MSGESIAMYIGYDFFIASFDIGYQFAGSVYNLRYFVSDCAVDFKIYIYAYV